MQSGGKLLKRFLLQVLLKKIKKVKTGKKIRALNKKVRCSQVKNGLKRGEREKIIEVA